MAEAFVLINVALGKEEEVLDMLRNIEGISLVSCVFGAYDIVTKVQATELLVMRSIITEMKRKIEHIRSTLALMIIDGQSDDQ